MESVEWQLLYRICQHIPSDENLTIIVVRKKFHYCKASSSPRGSWLRFWTWASWQKSNFEVSQDCGSLSTVYPCFEGTLHLQLTQRYESSLKEKDCFKPKKSHYFLNVPFFKTCGKPDHQLSLVFAES